MPEQATAVMQFISCSKHSSETKCLLTLHGGAKQSQTYLNFILHTTYITHMWKANVRYW